MCSKNVVGDAKAIGLWIEATKPFMLNSIAKEDTNGKHGRKFRLLVRKKRKRYILRDGDKNN